MNTAVTICCYCDAKATTRWNINGNPCCCRCYWQQYKFVRLIGDEYLARRYEQRMRSRGWEITARVPSNREAEGTYLLQEDGTLLPLDSAVGPSLRDYYDDSEDAYVAACMED